MLKEFWRESVDVVREKDPAFKAAVEVLLYPSFWAVVNHRIAHSMYKKGLLVPARLISQLSRFLTGIEIHPGATIGKRFFIDHGAGIVIGETAEIGDNVMLFHGVTLGGTGKDKGKRHPTLGKNVMVGAGAKVLGPFTVGDNSKIAANSVVLTAIPPNSTAVGIPAKIVKMDGKRVDAKTDQIHVPDPVVQQLCRLEHRIYQLEQENEQ